MCTCSDGKDLKLSRNHFRKILAQKLKSKRQPMLHKEGMDNLFLPCRMSTITKQLKQHISDVETFSEIEKLQEELVDSEAALDAKRKVYKVMYFILARLSWR